MATLADVRVLVVEDNAHMRLLLRSMLSAGGLPQVRERESAASGLQALSEGVDLVVVDWQMQPEDGLAFTRAARDPARSPCPYVPIIMLTAHTERSKVAAARDAGVSGFVKKPVSAPLLFSRITSVLTDKRLFIRSAAYVGPDRRRRQAAGYGGPFRREADGGYHELDLDDLRWRA